MTDECQMSAGERAAYANGYEAGVNDTRKNVACLIRISTLSEATQDRLIKILGFSGEGKEK
jgi:hypothetical protein